MTTVNDVLRYLEELAPVGLKMDFDNVGLLVGSAGAPVKRIVTALDVTDDVIDEAASLGAELIVAHHPVFFELKRVVDTDPVGARILKLAKNGISAICMHTNLDAAQGGVNDALADALGLKVLGVINETENVSRLCELEGPCALSDFLPLVRESLEANGLRYHDAHRSVHTVGICGGSGGHDLERAAAKGCDTFVSADLKYHMFLLAKDLRVNLIDAGHFPTENVVVPVLTRKLQERFPELEVTISTVLRQPEAYYMP